MSVPPPDHVCMAYPRSPPPPLFGLVCCALPPPTPMKRSLGPFKNLLRGKLGQPRVPLGVDGSNKEGGGEGESGLLRPNQASANICNRRLPLPGDGIPWMEGGNSRDSSLPPPLLLPWERKQEIGTQI